MTAITDEHRQQIEAAARSVAVKLEAFHGSLTPGEQIVLDAVLWQAAEPNRATEDVTGYTNSYFLDVINAVNWQKVYDAVAPKIDWQKAFEGVQVYHPR